MIIDIDPSFHMWVVLALTVVAVVLFVREKIPLEVSSVAVLTVLLLFGQFFPVYNLSGVNLMNAQALLAGFANPSLIAVLALLVMGQAIIFTDALRPLTNLLVARDKIMAWFSILGILLFVLVVSAFMNNTPLVVIAIPIIQALAHSMGMSESRLMIPLSFVAILGGMTTLIGSSTNLLVASSMTELGYDRLEFFDFVVPGAIMAGIGFVYVVFIAPLLLPDRSSMAQDLVGDQKEFVAEIDITPDSKLIGTECQEGKFPALGDMNIKLIQRAGHLILPPFEGYKIEAGDNLIVSATRESLTELLSKYPGFLLSEEESQVISDNKEQDEEDINKERESRVLAEIMITPASRMIDMSLEHVSFHKQFGTIVLGIQRRARVVRRRLGRIRLEAGDTLLIAGRKDVVDSLRNNPDFIVLSGSKRELHVPKKAPVALAVFLATIGCAASGVLSIPVAAIAGAVAMIATGCLNIRQATRAIDRKIYFLVGSMLALGTALQVTNGATFIAEQITMLPGAEHPLVLVSLLFLIVAIATNILTNNACAVLFTPIALNMAESLEVTQSHPYDMSFVFAVTVILAANCSFASPIGYQTNLLVMGPGHYRFRDFFAAGVPLMVILWMTFIGIAKFYYGL